MIISAIPLIYVTAKTYVPTFRERVNYIDYTFFMLRHRDRTGIGDINRLMSYKISGGLISQHPVTGVGTGNMMSAMRAEYHRTYPEVNEENVLLPHNQFLLVGLGCGVPAMLVFILWVFAPLTLVRRNRQSFFFFMMWLILFLQLMIEPVLEVQYGVFIYLFFLLLQKHEMESSVGRAPAKL